MRELERTRVIAKDARRKGTERTRRLRRMEIDQGVERASKAGAYSGGVVALESFSIVSAADVQKGVTREQQAGWMDSVGNLNQAVSNYCRAIRQPTPNTFLILESCSLAMLSWFSHSPFALVCTAQYSLPHLWGDFMWAFAQMADLMQAGIRIGNGVWVGCTRLLLDFIAGKQLVPLQWWCIPTLWNEKKGSYIYRHYQKDINWHRGGRRGLQERLLTKEHQWSCLRNLALHTVTSFSFGKTSRIVRC